VTSDKKEDFGLLVTRHSSLVTSFSSGRSLTEDEGLFTERSFDSARFFDRQAPLEIEIGSGKARFLVAAARANPDHDFLGLERALAYYRVCRDRVARAGLPNARILRADGRLFVEALPPESVRAFHIYFPDPWPKKRQKKRRLLDGVMLETVASRLEAGGLLRIATDHADYGSALAPLAATVAALERLNWEDAAEPPPTNYEVKYREEGRPIRRFLFRKRATGKLQDLPRSSRR
jgi:tRNA (guanine-N7-)-methyltransferase